MKLPIPIFAFVGLGLLLLRTTAWGDDPDLVRPLVLSTQDDHREMQRQLAQDPVCPIEKTNAVLVDADE